MESFNDIILSIDAVMVWRACLFAAIIYLIIHGRRQVRASQESIDEVMSLPEPWSDDHTPSAEDIAAIKDYGRRTARAEWLVKAARDNDEQLQRIQDEIAVVGTPFTSDPEIGGILISQHEDSEKILSHFTIAEIRRLNTEQRSIIFRTRNCSLADGNTFETAEAGEAHERIQKRAYVAAHQALFKGTDKPLSEGYKLKGMEHDWVSCEEAGLIEPSLSDVMEAEATVDTPAYLVEPIGSEAWYYGNPRTYKYMNSLELFLSPEHIDGSKEVVTSLLRGLAGERFRAYLDGGGAQTAAVADTGQDQDIFKAKLEGYGEEEIEKS